MRAMETGLWALCSFHHTTNGAVWTACSGKKSRPGPRFAAKGDAMHKQQQKQNMMDKVRVFEDGGIRQLAEDKQENK